MLQSCGASFKHACLVYTVFGFSVIARVLWNMLAKFLRLVLQMTAGSAKIGGGFWLPSLVTGSSSIHIHLRCNGFLRIALSSSLLKLSQHRWHNHATLRFDISKGTAKQTLLPRSLQLLFLQCMFNCSTKLIEAVCSTNVGLLAFMHCFRQTLVIMLIQTSLSRLTLIEKLVSGCFHSGRGTLVSASFLGNRKYQQVVHSHPNGLAV